MKTEIHLQWCSAQFLQYVQSAQNPKTCRADSLILRRDALEAFLMFHSTHSYLRFYRHKIQLQVVDREHTTVFERYFQHGHDFVYGLETIKSQSLVTDEQCWVRRDC
jgi:hypothetical protein